MKIQGVDKLMKKLKRLEKAGARRALTKATRAGMTPLRKTIKAATPVDQGLLKKAQDSKVAGRGLRRLGIVGANVAKLEADAEADKSRPTNIDQLVEFGHTAPNGTVVPPSAYMRRSAALAMPRAEAAYAAKLKTEIEREASR